MMLLVLVLVLVRVVMLLVLVIVDAGVRIADHIDLRVVVFQIRLGADVMLRQIFRSQRLQIDGDSFGPQFARLPFESFGQLFPAIGSAQLTNGIVRH